MSSEQVLPGITPDSSMVFALWLKAAAKGEQWALDKLMELATHLRAKHRALS